MDASVDVGMLIKAALMLIGIMVIFFGIAVITPRLAKLVDKWLENYRSKRSDTGGNYDVRSIYELPPKKKETSSEDPEQAASPESVSDSDPPASP